MDISGLRAKVSSADFNRKFFVLFPIAQFVERNGKVYLLLDEGFVYHRTKSSHGKEYWRCGQDMQGTKITDALVVVTQSQFLIQSSGFHTHSPNLNHKYDFVVNKSQEL